MDDAPRSKNSQFLGASGLKIPRISSGRVFSTAASTHATGTKHAARRDTAQPRACFRGKNPQIPEPLFLQCMKPSWVLRGTPLPPGAPSGVIATLPDGGSVWDISEHKNHIFPPHMSPPVSSPHGKQHRDVYPDPISAAPASSRASPLGCSGCTSPPSEGFSVPTFAPITQWGQNHIQGGHGLQVSRKAHMGQTQPAPCTLTAPHTLMLCPQTPRDPSVAMQDPGNNSSRGTELSPKPSPCPLPSPKSAVLQPNGKPKPTKLRPGATPVVPPALHTHTVVAAAFQGGSPQLRPKTRMLTALFHTPFSSLHLIYFFLQVALFKPKLPPQAAGFRQNFGPIPTAPSPSPTRSVPA